MPSIDLSSTTEKYRSDPLKIIAEDGHTMTPAEMRALANTTKTGKSKKIRAAIELARHWYAQTAYKVSWAKKYNVSWDAKTGVYRTPEGKRWSAAAARPAATSAGAKVGKAVPWTPAMSAHAPSAKAGVRPTTGAMSAHGAAPAPSGAPIPAGGSLTRQVVDAFGVKRTQKAAPGHYFDAKGVDRVIPTGPVPAGGSLTTKGVSAMGVPTTVTAPTGQYFGSDGKLHPLPAPVIVPPKPKPLSFPRTTSSAKYVRNPGQKQAPAVPSPSSSTPKLKDKKKRGWGNTYAPGR